MNLLLAVPATALLFATGLGANAAVLITENYSFPVGAPAGNIPDSGLSTAFSETVSGSQIQNLTAVRVGLHLTGASTDTGWAGDLFVSLNRDLGSQTAVLLNQVGVSGSDPAGFGYDGWNVTLRDDTATDIHTHSLGSGVLTGAYQPDGRLHPTDTGRPASLAVFDGLTGDGTWHLSLADLSFGGSMVLQGWSLELVGEGFAPVPEPDAIAAVAGVALLGWAAARRRN